MNAGPVVDRVYARLRERLLHHHYRPGERLEVAELSADLTSSNTPVRDALNRLVGEGLVATPEREGFNVPGFDEPGLADLYHWSGDLMRLALATSGRSSCEPLAAEAGDISYASRVAGLFEAIAALSDNAEHARAVENCSARLSAARTVEPELFRDTEAELSEIGALFHERAIEPLRQALRRYHARRTRRAGALVRLLYRGRN